MDTYIEMSIDGDTPCSEVVLGFRDFLARSGKHFRFASSDRESGEEQSSPVLSHGR